MKRIWAVGIALTLGSILLPHEAVPTAEAKAKSARDASAPSTKPSTGQRKKKPNSLYFPEEMLKRKKNHPDFLWAPVK
jgi:hypothetical protein